ncbi:IS4 family transposase [Chryseolinea soli]|nr:IS4 family transposase [Chryseolinea soli]
MEGHYESLAGRISGKDLICIQDTSEYMYGHHKGILKDGTLGRITDDYNLGLRVHPMLVLDANDEFAYGFSSLEIVNREAQAENKTQRKYKQLPVEEKESYRWINAALNTKQVLQKANSITIVADRESDIYQLWSRIPDEKTHLVVRSSLTRIFKNEGGEKLDPTDRQKRVGQITLLIPADFDKKRKAREAKIELYVQKAQTRRPVSLRSSNDGQHVPLYVVVAKEVINQREEIQDPVEWILLTDIKTDTLEEATTIISIYRSRWNIEQIFRLTKQKGFQLESSQLETGHAIENLIAMVFIAAIRIFQMVKSRNDQGRLALDLFDAQEITLLTKVNKGLEGSSPKSKNINRPESIAFIVWIVARLGNWKPEDKDPPGPITLLKGWIVLQNYLKVNQILLSN